MLLAIDVGNTETKLGCFADGDRLVHHWRVTTEAKRTADEYGVFITQLFATAQLKTNSITAVVIASVVPRLDRTLAEVCEKFFKVVPHFLHPEKQTLMPIRTERPAEVGADLVAAAIGAKSRYGAPLIVASYGTASVFTAISPEGEYLGVAIAPGINISIDALVGRAAKLPQVAFSPPSRAIGRNTIEALQSGIIHGFVGQTEYIVAKIREELHTQARVVATGGLSETIAQHTKVIDVVDPFLSLTGLHLFFAAATEGSLDAKCIPKSL